ncbi:hypothetical protein [Chitinophaga silvisoli]|uniref:Uncharacterized protein n=1 Tax=Chitinophaga silvisoli TaxID=2291814 RepID=A0A3E1NKH5_9BACT|nr:hypothetical protein [Chitinophaga silvisoli]RFM28381.1 hypothetical protein DXN04_34320 [Chitinophaga silvisoli]
MLLVNNLEFSLSLSQASRNRVVSTDGDKPYGLEDCNQLLNRFFQKSSFKSPFQKNLLIVSVDDVKDSIVTIKVSSEEGNNLTVGWLHLDLKGKKLTNITSDPDKPISLEYDKSVLDSLMNNCTFSNTE